MNVSLTPELEAFIQHQVEAGTYRSASEVVRQALRLLLDSEHERHARLSALRRDIQAGLDSGPPEPYDRQAFLDRLLGRDQV